MYKIRFFLGIMLWMAAFLAAAPPLLAQPPPAPTFVDFADFQAQLDAVIASGNSEQLDAFWDTLIAHQMIPLTLGDTVVFLFRCDDAESVAWCGDFNNWNQARALQGKRLGESSIWMATIQLPPDARVDYQIIVNEALWRTDPANPCQQLGGLGPNSEIAMPEFEYSEWVVVRDDIAEGTLSENTRINSTTLGYVVQYRVYTPAGYDGSNRLPVIYVLDGHEYTHPQMGAMPIILDNLIADGLIRPVMAVFVDPRNPDLACHNRRDDEYLENDRFAAFLARELVSIIDQDYHTLASVEGRALLGTSYGGLAVTYIQRLYPETFGLLGIQSPAYWAASRLWPLLDDDSIPDPLRVFVASGNPDWDADITETEVRLQTEEIPCECMVVNQGHSWGQWRTEIDELLIYFYGD